MPSRRALALIPALLALAALLCAPAAAHAQTPIVLDGTIADGTPQYFTLPFTVPEGIHEIEVRHDDLSATNILDWGLRDPTRFRGWGGGNTEPAVVGEMAASRSYLPGAIPAGQWAVMIGQAKIVERPARYHIEIVLRTTPTLAPQPERRPYAHVPALATGARWYAGDFHVHSRESGDASPTLDAIATFARSRGLDFVELSDHNTVSQLDFIGDAQSRHPDLLLVPGIEVTTYQGHANAIGATQWIDFTVGSGPMVTIDTITAAAATLDAPFSINHPVLDLGDQCTGCAWMLMNAPERVAAIEVQNGQYSVTGALFYARAVRFWEGYLARGVHVAALGGSDDHSAGADHGALSSPIGGPTTMVYATELSVPALVAAVRAGHTVVKLQGPDGPMVELTAEGGAIVGDTVRARHATLHATVTHAMGGLLSFVRDGARMPTIAVTGDPFTTTLEVDAPPGMVDDRYRCELIADGQPRVLTSHIWVAATGEPIPMDAGIDASGPGDAGAPSSDAGSEPPTTAHGGCGCRAVAGSGRDDGAARGAWAAVLALSAMMARRRREKPSD